MTTLLMPHGNSFAKPHYLLKGTLSSQTKHLKDKTKIDVYIFMPFSAIMPPMMRINCKSILSSLVVVNEPLW